MPPSSSRPGGAVPGHVAWVGRAAGTAPATPAPAGRALLSLVDTALSLGVTWLTVQEPTGGRALREQAADLAADRQVVVAVTPDGPADAPVAPHPLVPVASPRLHVFCAEQGSGRRDLVRAVRQLEAARIAPHAVDEASIGGALGVPDVDLLVLTGSDRRVPDLLVWQVAYSEIVVLEETWPEIGAPQFHAAVAEYQRRDRRYGGLVAPR